MSIRFTIAPVGSFSALAMRLFDQLASDPLVELVTNGPETIATFAGLARLRDVTIDGRGLARLRILDASLVFDVDLEAFEPSAKHLERHVREILETDVPCRIFDNETGSELTWRLEACPDTLFLPELEFE